MFAILIKFAFGNRASASISTLVIVAAVLFGWHKIDKTSAVRKAVAGYVADVELATMRAQIEEANRRAIVAADARDRLEERLATLEGTADRQAREIERYEIENEVNPVCRVDDRVLERLRGN